MISLHTRVQNIIFNKMQLFDVDFVIVPRMVCRLHTSGRLGPTSLPRSISIFHLFFVHVPVQLLGIWLFITPAARRIRNFLGIPKINDGAWNYSKTWPVLFRLGFFWDVNQIGKLYLQNNILSGNQLCIHIILCIHPIEVSKT